MKNNYIPFNIEALLIDTQFLSPEEFGVYVKLICWHYKFGEEGLPNDDKKLSKILGINPRTFRKIFANIEHYFFVENGNLRHLKCVKELRKVAERSANARAKVLKRFNTGHTKDKDKDKSIIVPNGTCAEVKTSTPRKSSLFLKEEAKSLDGDWKTKPLPPANVVEMWNVIVLDKNPQKKIHLTGKRKQKILLRTAEEFKTGECWQKYFLALRRSSFHMGNNDRGWTAKIDWALEPRNIINYLEGGLDE